VKSTNTVPCHSQLTTKASYMRTSLPKNQPENAANQQCSHLKLFSLLRTTCQCDLKLLVILQSTRCPIGYGKVLWVWRVLVIKLILTDFVPWQLFRCVCDQVLAISVLRELGILTLILWDQTSRVWIWPRDNEWSIGYWNGSGWIQTLSVSVGVMQAGTRFQYYINCGTSAVFFILHLSVSL